MIKFAARLNVNLAPDDLLARCGLQPFGPVQRVVDQTVIDYCIEGGYVPAGPNRALEGSAQISTEIGSGQVVWNTPYARYQYYGQVMTDEAGRTWVGPGEKKPVVTDRPLVYDTAQNARAGSYWFERMKADRLNDILDTARRAVTDKINRKD